VRQRAHNTLVTVSVAKEHFGAFWSVLVMLFFHLDFVSPSHLLPNQENNLCTAQGQE
jgi:hypothetical protein